ncbi:MAG: NADH-quinone oxidoreductase subunit M, partial [Bacteroidales bacterium]|nr:NADH-quinone oxidoreductase subunit M [Bacteroidales bacterium]
MDLLSYFVIVPVLMLLGFIPCKNIKQVRAVAVIGSTIELIMAVALLILFINERNAGNTADMLFMADYLWYPALNIHYSVGVDGISVVMILLSAIIVFTGVFASWNLQPLTRDFFIWLTLLAIGVYGFFISIDMFTMVLFYETALIPMYLLIGLWG